MKRKFVLLLSLLLPLVLCATVYAAMTYSDPGTFVLNPGSTWVCVTTQGQLLGNDKTTNAPDINVYTLAKTMSSRPNFRIVNSNGEERSDSVKTPVPLEQKTYEGVSTAEVGYGYYASLQPNWAQTGENKTIRIQFKVY